MAEFTRLWHTRGSVIAELETLLQEAESSRETEFSGALAIQRSFRGARTRAKITNQSRACVEIQRVFRGHVGRQLVKEAAAARQAHEAESMYHYYAGILQRVFKGYYSRKYHHDFFARKAYIESIKTKSDELRNQLSTHMSDQMEKHAEDAEQKAMDEFKKVTQNLHHLLSTASTPGVYNPPYAMDQVPTAFGVPVEEHLRAGVKDLLRSTGLRRVKPASYAPKSRTSVQASSQYGVVEQKQRDEKRYSKMRHLSTQPFVAGTRSRKTLPDSGLSAGTPYEEPWRIARSQREMEHTAAAKAKRVSSSAFHGTVTRGRMFEEYERRKAAGPAQPQSATMPAKGSKGLGGSRKKRGFVDTMRSLTLASEHTAY